MAFDPCFSCGLKFPGKVTTTYGRWPADEDYVSYTMKTCLSCVDKHLASMVRASILNGTQKLCHVCSQDLSASAIDHLFLTVYLPKREMEQFHLLACPGCLTHTKAWFEEFGLWNRRPDLGGSWGPKTSETLVQDLPW